MAGDAADPAFPKANSRWRLWLLLTLSGGLALLLLAWTGPLSIRGGAPVAVDFAYIGPLKPGAAVRIAGVVVGVVEAVDFLGGQSADAGPEVMVRVHLRVEERARPVLTERAQVYVTTLGVLGEHYVDIRPVAGGTRLAAGATLRGIDLARADLLLPRAAALLETMAGAWQEGAPALRDARAALRTLAALAQRAEALLADEAVGPDRIAGAGAEFRDALGEARDIVAALHAALGDGKGLGQLLRSIEAMSAQGERLAGAVSPEDVQGLLRSGQGALAGAEQALAGYVAGPLGTPEGQAALLSSLQETLARMDRLVSRADRLLGQLEAGEGAAGKAFQDEAMLEDLKAVLRGLRATPLGRMGE